MWLIVANGAAKLLFNQERGNAKQEKLGNTVLEFKGVFQKVKISTNFSLFALK